MSSFCACSTVLPTSRKVAVRSTLAGSPVLAVKAQRQSRRASQAVVASADRRREALSAAVVTSVGVAMANPLVAQAGVTPTLKNLVSSVIAGTVVLGAIAIAITAVSNFDPVRR